MKNYITGAVQNEAIDALEKLISHPSYLTDAKINAPFGQGIRDALDEVISICAKLGFNTYVDPKGYYGYAEVGEGEKIFGIIGHVDVVPEGDISSWNTNPFELVQKDGKLYGRGTQDDKGPTIAAIYAVKAMLDQGVKFNHRIRFIFGTDEETLWRGMAEYNKNEDPIDMGIAPDAEFPLIYAEKGLQQSYLVGPGSDKLELNLVSAFNAVPGLANYSGPKQAEVKETLSNHGFEFEESDNEIIVKGNSVHAMNAPEGTNAMVRLAIALADVFPGVELLEFVKAVGEDATGSNILGEVKDDVSGQLTFNISSLEISKEQSKIQIDMRIPVKIDHDELINTISEKIASYKLKYENFDYLAPLYVSEDSELVKKLMQAYQEVTGDTVSKPSISGGATFARTMNQSVAFGAMLTTTPDFMHQANENWSVNDMRKAMEIYVDALEKLVVR